MKTCIRAVVQSNLLSSKGSGLGRMFGKGERDGSSKDCLWIRCVEQGNNRKGGWLVVICSRLDKE